VSVKPRHVRNVLLLGVAACVSLVALTGCSNKTVAQNGTDGQASLGASSTESTPSTATTEPQEGTLYTPTYVPNGAEIAVIKTNKGVVKVKLYGKDAPVNTANFIELAQKGYYDKVKFHRLEPGFVIQGGDPQTAKISSKQVEELVAKQKTGAFTQGDPMLGTGGPGYVIKGEFDPSNIKHPHVDGSLAMARTNDPDSAGSQFYFTLGPQAFLDGKYTVFGDTISGLPVVHELEVGDVIESVTIENATK
jgi:peptidyl-prolyl cis-trans isomerase B (cyclophilin B)